MDDLAGRKSVFDETVASSWLMTLFANDEYTGRRQEYNRMKNWLEHFRSSNDNLSCEDILMDQTQESNSGDEKNLHLLQIQSIKPSWPVPALLSTYLRFSISMTYYDAALNRFYGTTYSTEVEYDQQTGSVLIDRLLLFRSKDDEESYVVIELVAANHNDANDNEGTYSCGWSLLKLKQDIEVPIYCGTPRQLFTHPASVIENRSFFVESGAKMCYKTCVVTDKSVNQVLNGIGALSKNDHFIPATNEKLPGIDVRLQNVNNNDASIDNMGIRVSSKIPFNIQIMKIGVRFGESRVAYENRMIESILQSLPSQPIKEPQKKRMFLKKLTRRMANQQNRTPPTGGEHAPESYPIILSRKVKFAVHNGYSFIPQSTIGRKFWKELELTNDDKAVDSIETDGIIELDSFHKHPLCAIITLIEYTIKASLETNIDLVLGCQICLPFDGDSNDGEEEKDRSISLPLISDNTCRAFTQNRVFSPIRSISSMVDNPIMVDFDVRSMNHLQEYDSSIPANSCKNCTSEQVKQSPVKLIGPKLTEESIATNKIHDDGDKSHSGEQPSSKLRPQPSEAALLHGTESTTKANPNHDTCVFHTSMIQKTKEVNSNSEEYDFDTDSEISPDTSLSIVADDILCRKSLIPRSDQSLDEKKDSFDQGDNKRNNQRKTEDTPSSQSHLINAENEEQQKLDIDEKPSSIAIDLDKNCKKMHGEIINQTPNNEAIRERLYSISSQNESPGSEVANNQTISKDFFIGSDEDTSSGSNVVPVEAVVGKAASDKRTNTSIMADMKSPYSNDDIQNGHRIVQAQRLVETNKQLQHFINVVKEKQGFDASTCSNRNIMTGANLPPWQQQSSVSWQRRHNFFMKYIRSHGPMLCEELLEAVIIDWHRRGKKHEFLTHIAKTNQTV